MRCQYKDCVHYYQGHLACFDCFRSKGLQDYYQPKGVRTLEYTVKGRIVNLAGSVWDEYCRSRLSKRHAEQILYCLQRVQELLMREVLEDAD